MKVDQDVRRSIDDNRDRLDRAAWQERMWREKVGLAGGEQGKSNFRVPLIQALCFAKHGREIDALFGVDPTVKATPRGPVDIKTSKKIGLAMKWQVYENMRAVKPIALWALRRLKHGRSFAYVPWETKYYNKTVMDEVTGQRRTERVIYHEGPEVYPLGNDEIWLPPSVEGKTNFDSVQNAEWVVRRYWDTPTNMLRCDNVPGTEQNPEGDWYQGIKENWKRLLIYSKYGMERDSDRDATFIEIDIAEGVWRDASSTYQRESIEVWEWHGKWRRWVDEEPQTDDDAVFEAGEQYSAPVPGVDNTDQNRPHDPGYEQSPYIGAGGEPAREPEPNSGAAENQGSSRRLSMDEAMEYFPDADVEEDGTFIDADGRRKYMLESDLIVRYAGRLNLIIGVQDAAEVYPDTPYKRPILEMALLNDGQYWCMGLIELIQEIEKELCSLANQVIEAVGLSIGPPIVAEPAVGENLANHKYEKNDIIWVANAAGVKQLTINPNIEPFNTLWQMFMSIQEMLTGITQMTMGRGMEQPNAPRTLGGQRLVMGAGDVRLALDMRNLGEDLKHFLDHVWDLWQMFGSEGIFFRVSEGDSRGLFDAGELQNQGWSKLSAIEREGRYDFTLEFADDAQVREGKKQEYMALLQAVGRMPIFMNDAAAQYRLIIDVFELFGLDATKYLSEPPPAFAPRTPIQEWSMALRRDEDLHVHPQDDDEAHIQDHTNRIMAMYAGPEKDRNVDAMWQMQQHIDEHEKQKAQKLQTQELLQGITGMLQAAQQGGAADPNNPLAALMGTMPKSGVPIPGGNPQSGNGQQPTA
jgi:hypothetical protein